VEAKWITLPMLWHDNQKPDEDSANPTHSSGTWPFSDSPRIAGWNHPQNLWLMMCCELTSGQDCMVVFVHFRRGISCADRLATWIKSLK
jgi:hypothetical protein